MSSEKEIQTAQTRLPEDASKDELSSENMAVAKELPKSSTRDSLVRMIRRAASTSSVVPQITPKAKPKRMLTGGQLSDLFRRLDKDGNGELDLEEFSEIINKLKIKASEDFVARIFRTVDTAKSGTLSMQEFVTAYQMIYTQPSTSTSQSRTKGTVKRKPVEFICAVRYGTDMSGRSVFECMLGNVTEMPDGPLFLMYEKRLYNLRENHIGSETASNPGDRVEDLEYEVASNWSATLHDLNESITRDALNNKTSRSKIYWWIDISMKKVASFRVDKYIAGLGLPNDSKFRASFGQFGSCLPRDEKSRIYASNGQSQLGGVSSLSFYTQSLWVLGAPVVHHIPAWLDNFIEMHFSDYPKKAAREYYNTRFGFFFRAGKSENSSEFFEAFSNAQLIADRLDGDTEYEAEELPVESKAASAAAGSTHNILKIAPLPAHSRSSYKSEPSWLLSASEIKKRPTRLQFDTISLHILNQGHGPACLVTIREIDEEEEVASNHKKDVPVMENSKTGIIGRIVTGTRLKILKNLYEDGITSVAGDLTDSPAALACTLMTLVHNFDMNTLGAISSWMTLVANEVDDLAVSKHSSHAKEMSGIVSLLQDYVEPTLQIFGSLYAEGAKKRANDARDAEEAALRAAEAEENASESNVLEGREKLMSLPSGSSDSSSDDERNDKVAIPVTPMPVKKFIPVARSGPRVSVGRRTSGLGSMIQLSFTTLPNGCQCVPITFETIQGFLGADPCQNLEKLIDGDESLEVKGMRYWSEQLNVLKDSVLKVKDDIRVSLEEKRNFFSFVLTVVTVFLAPLTILTGYWGMNFNNMTELDEETYKFAPGVKLLWVTAFVVYATFTVLSIHFRILYSAT